MPGRPAISPESRIRRELRHRVDALHRQWEQATLATRSREIDAQQSLHVSIVDAPALTLASEIGQEFGRQGRHRAVNDKMLEQVRGWAMTEGKWAFARDPSIRVCAAFAVEMATHMGTRSLPFDGTVPDCLIAGSPYTSCFDALKNAWVFQESDTDWPSPLTRPDQGRAGRVTVNWEKVRGEALVPASWTPTQPRSAFTCDVMRPPVEALALTTAVVPGPTRLGLCPEQYPAVLLIGAGWCGGAQALSMLLRFQRVFHLPVPFGDKVTPPKTKWDAVVINVPSAHHWQVAKTSARQEQLPARVHRATLRGRHGKQGNNEHVATIIEVAKPHLQRGCPVVLMADMAVQAFALNELRNTANLIAEPVHGIDTSKQAIWVGYDPPPPWAPHGFPSPSGRLVSFWKVAP